ncbi:MAG TPA: aminoglycoside phosphotransferase family protein [Anaerolineae bacterium]|nr:aminoglycoside phosphotransferase family protein [Anaerolineae bacterium]
MDKGPLLSTGRTAEVYAWGSDHVLKLYRANMPAEMVHEEARIGHIVAIAGLHAPAVGETVEVDGRLGILYERIAGPSMLDVLTRRPWQWRGLARQLAEVHAAMHNTARPELPSQRHGFAWAIAHAPRLDEAARQRVLAALERMPGGESVCHGDYHPANVILSPRGPVVIDWMTSCHGNPVADVARTVLLLRFAVLPRDMGLARRAMIQLIRRPFLSAYLRAYGALRPLLVNEVEGWLPILAAARMNEGIDAEEALLQRLVSTV